MANIRQLKRRISTSQNISKITKAMQMVAASKMKKAQNQALKTRAFAHALNNSLKKISKTIDPSLHPLLKKNESGKKILVLLSTEKGLCGSFNANLFKKTIEWLKENPDGELILLGKKAITFAQNNGLKIFAKFEVQNENPELSDILPISQILIEKYLNLEFSSIEIIYMDFINTLKHDIRTEQILPLQSEKISSTETDELEFTSEYSFEPSAKIILNELLPHYIENFLYQALLESKASEHSSRMIAMKNASDNAKELVKDLSLIYNKSRQEAITNEILEISSASLTLGN